MWVIELWRSDAGIFVLSVGLLGLIVGSFINVVVYRLPKMLMQDWRQQAREILQLPAETDSTPYNLARPNSSCPNCGHQLKFWEKIPLLSWLYLRARCSACRAPISWHYPLVEVACGLLSALIAWRYGVSLAGGAMLLCTWSLLTMSLIDAQQQIVPDVIVLPMLWLGLILNSFGVFVSLPEAFWGAVIGYMSLWTVFWLFKWITGREGMGYGDFKLLAMLGAWGGWQVLPGTILVSSALGSIVGVLILRWQGNHYSQPIAFAPFIAIAGFIVLLWGNGMLFIKIA